MKNIHVIQTDKPSRLHYWDGILKINNSDIPLGLLYQNIYITSDEEIKEDYVIAYGVVIKVMMFDKETLYFVNGTKAKKEDCKKIILTTDQDLIKYGVQAIDDDFLEWFVQNPSCELVPIANEWKEKYKIIIPQEEQKQHLIDIMKKDEELGLYDIFNDEKRQGVKELIDKHKQHFYCSDRLELDENESCGTQCERCADIQPKYFYEKEESKQDDENYLDSFGVTKTQFEAYRNFNKQKTLEGLADKWVFETNGHKWSNNNNEAGDNFGSFIAGFKEAEKTLYSEEDMAESFMACWKANVPEGFECKLSFNEWFEQFKNK